MVSSNHLGKDETQDGFTRIGPNADLRSMHELVINLSRAHTVKSMADTVANYCGKVFQSPAGAIFVERNGNLEIISQWRSRRAPKKHLAEEIIMNGPAARVFRTGKPIFCRTPGAAQSSISRYLHRLLRRCRSGSATFSTQVSSGTSCPNWKTNPNSLRLSALRSVSLMVASSRPA